MQIQKTSAQLDGNSGSLMIDSQKLMLDSQKDVSAWGAPPQPPAQQSEAQAQPQPQVQAKRLDLADFHDTDGAGSLTDDSSFASGGVADAVSPTPRAHGRELPFSQGRGRGGLTHIYSVPTPVRPPRPKKQLQDLPSSAVQKKQQSAAKQIIERAAGSITPMKADRVYDPEALTNSLVIDYEARASQVPSRASTRTATPIQDTPPLQVSAPANKTVVALDLKKLDSTLNGHLLAEIGTPMGTPKTPAKMPFGRGRGRGEAQSVVTLPDALQLSAPRRDKDEEARQKTHASLRSSRLSRIDIRTPVTDAQPEVTVDKRFEPFLNLQPNENAKITRLLTLANCDLKTLPQPIYRRLCDVAPHCTVLRLDGRLTTSFIGSIADLFTNVDCLHFSDIQYSEFQEISLVQFTKLKNLTITNSTGFFATFAKDQPVTLSTLYVEACPGFFPHLMAKLPHLKSLQGIHFAKCDDLQTSQIQQLALSYSHVQDIGIEDCDQVAPSISEAVQTYGVNVHFAGEDEARDELEPEPQVVAERIELKAKSAVQTGTVTFGDLSHEPSPKNVLVHDSRGLQRTASRAKSISDISLSAISALSDGSAASGSKRKVLYEQGLQATLMLADVFKKLLALEGGTPDRPVPSPTPSQAQSEVQAERPSTGNREAAEDAVSVSNSSVRTVRAELKQSKQVEKAIASLTSSMRGLSVDGGQKTPRRAADYKKFETTNFTGNASAVSALFTEAQLNLDTIPRAIYGKVKSAASMITRLDVPGAQLTGKNLKKLSTDFPKLRTLNVINSVVHKGALRELKGITQLHIAESVGFDDKAVQDLGCREKLEHLDCSATAVKDGGIKQLLAFPALKTLIMKNTAFSDAHLLIATKVSKLEITGCMHVTGPKVEAAKTKGKTIIF